MSVLLATEYMSDVYSLVLSNFVVQGCVKERYPSPVDSENLTKNLQHVTYRNGRGQDVS